MSELNGHCPPVQVWPTGLLFPVRNASCALTKNHRERTTIVAEGTHRRDIHLAVVSIPEHLPVPMLRSHPTAYLPYNRTFACGFGNRRPSGEVYLPPRHRGLHC